MNTGIILALVAMLANSGYDIAMQQNAVRIKGDKNKFLFVLSVVSFLIGLVMSVVKHIYLFRFANIFYGIVCGIVAFGGYYAYLISMYGKNRSVYTIFIRLSFILSIVFSFLFLGDELNLFKILAIVLCCGAMLLLCLNQDSGKSAGSLNNKQSSKGRFKDKYLLAALVSCLFLAALNTVNKYAANDNVDTFAVLFWRYVTFSLILLLLLIVKRLKYRHSKNSTIIKTSQLQYKKQFFFFAGLAGILIFISIFSSIEAFKHNDISIVLPITQLSFVVTMFFNKHYYKEKMTMFKYAGAVIAFISIVLVTLK